MTEQHIQLQLNKKYYMSLFLTQTLMNSAKFFLRVAELGSQDAQDLKNVIYDSFKKNNFQKVSLKIIFLASDGETVG